MRSLAKYTVVSLEVTVKKPNSTEVHPTLKKSYIYYPQLH